MADSSLDLSPDTVRQLFELRATAGREESFEAWLPYIKGMVTCEAAEALRIAVEFCVNGPDEAGLCWVGVCLLEPLLATHGVELINSFERETRRCPALRQALSCAVLDLPSKVERRYLALLDADYDLGRSQRRI